MVNLFYFTFVIFGVSDASESKSGSSMTNESICWATGASGSESESSALGVPPFFLPWCRAGCSAVGVKVREMGAAVWPLGSGALDATFGFVMWITGLKQGDMKICLHYYILVFYLIYILYTSFTYFFLNFLTSTHTLISYSNLYALLAMSLSSSAAAAAGEHSSFLSKSQRNHRNSTTVMVTLAFTL